MGETYYMFSTGFFFLLFEKTVVVILKLISLMTLDVVKMRILYEELILDSVLIFLSLCVRLSVSTD